MFSSGQWVFALLFLITFVIVAIYVYKKDAALHKQYYKGSSKVLIFFLLFIFLLLIMKIFLKR